MPLHTPDVVKRFFTGARHPCPEKQVYGRTWLGIFLLAGTLIQMPSAFAQTAGKAFSDAQLLSLWQKSFSTPQAFQEPDLKSGGPMSPICIGGMTISPPKAKHPLIFLKLQTIAKAPPAGPSGPPLEYAVAGQPSVIATTAQTYLLLFKADFPDTQHNPYYLNGVENNGVAISYIGFEVYAVPHGQGDRNEGGSIIAGFNVYLYPSAVTSGENPLTYAYLTSYSGATELAYVGSETACQ